MRAGNGNPAVSIGLPVRNGEKYLREAIDSLLAQTYSDFELIISDNASTDNTALICQEYARRDSRIRYCRFEQNIGAAGNYNHVFEISHGRYFKWAAHDDICAPEFLSRCLAALEKDGSLVLCYPQVIIIDENGCPIGGYDEGKNLASGSVVDRFKQLFQSPKECNAVFGVIRSDALARTSLIGSYFAADRNLLAELALLGRFHEVPERLFLRRDHPHTSLRANRSNVDRAAWFNPMKVNKAVLPTWKRLYEYAKAIVRSPNSFSVKLTCCRLVVKSAWDGRRKLVKELIAAGMLYFGRATQ